MAGRTPISEIRGFGGPKRKSLSESRKTEAKMSQDISPAEIQLCLAAKNIRKPSFTKDELRTFGEMAFRDGLQDWNESLASFCKRGLLHVDEDHYSLSP